MGKMSNLVVIISAILAAGVLTAGCTQDSGSALQLTESTSTGIQAVLREHRNGQ